MVVPVTNGMRRVNGAVVTPSIGYTLLISMVDVLSVVNRTHLVPITLHPMFGGRTLPLRIELNGIKQ